MSMNIEFTSTSSVLGINPAGIADIVGGFPSGYGTMPPLAGIGLQAQPLLPELTRNQLLDALLVSNNSMLRQIIATSSYNPDALIQTKGYDVLDSMKTFAAYYTPLHLLVTSALHKEWKIKAKVDGKIVNENHPRFAIATEIAEFIEHCCQNIVDEDGWISQDFQDVIWQTLEPGVHYGFSTQEIQYRVISNGKWKGKLGLQRFIYRHPNTIRFNLDPYTDQVKSLNCQTTLGGWQNYIRSEKFIQFTFRKQNGLPFGWGVARPCYKHTFALDTLTRLLNEALQRYGMGFIKATVTNPTDAFICKVEKYLASVNSGKPLIETPDMMMELIQMSGGALDPIEKAIRYHGEQISAHILGQTLTTSTGGSSGSYALAAVHEGTQKYFTGFPRRRVEITFEKQLFAQLVKMNFGLEYMDCVPGLDLGVYDLAELAMMADSYKKLVDGGIVHNRESFIRDRMGIPEYDPSTPQEQFLPDKEQLRVNVNQNPDGSTGGGSGE